MTENRTAIILAGGESKRFGEPKALLKFDDKLIVEIIVNKLQEFFSEIIIVTDDTEPLRHLPVILTEDILADCKKSSLRGLHAGLKTSTSAYNFVIACDMPFVNLLLIKYMHSIIPECDAVIPRVGEYLQPLYAFYHKECVDTIEKCLLAGKFKIIDLYRILKIRYIEKEDIQRIDPEQKAFFNINTDVDFEIARKMFLQEKQAKSVWGG